MLNIERKDVYIGYISSFSEIESCNNVRSTLRLFGDFEDIIQKDICDWTITDIKDGFISINCTSLTMLMNHRSRLMMYTQWCINNKLSNVNQNYFESFNDDLLDGCLNKILIKNQLILRDDLVSRFSNLYNARDKFLILALYEGIGAYGEMLEEVLSITNRDIIKRTGNTIKLCTGREICISDLLIEYANESMSQIGYVVRKSSITKDIIYSRDSTDDHVFWKVAYELNDRDNDTMRNALRTIKKRSVAMNLNSMTALKYIKAGRYDYVTRKANEIGISILEYEIRFEREINATYGIMSFGTRKQYLDSLKEIVTE